MGKRVTLYREVCQEELVRITREGLRPTPACYKPRETRQEMELLDRFRPPHIVAQGVERLRAIYATPTPVTPKLPFRTEHIVIAFEADVERAWVADMDFITCLIPFIDAHREGIDQFAAAFCKYWESVIPLETYLEDGERRAAIRAPEVLVMQDMVVPEKVRCLSEIF